MSGTRAVREHLAVTPELLPEVLADHLDRLYRAAWALCGSREDAEDLVQETYARVLAKKRVDRLRRRRAPVPADRAAQHVPQLAAHALAAPAHGGARGRASRGSPRPAATGPQAIVEARAVFAAIAALPDDQRDVVAAVDVAGLSYAEAAESLGVPAGTIMSRLHRGRVPRGRRAVGASALEVDGALALPGGELEQLVGRDVRGREHAGAAVAAPGDDRAVAVL